MTASEYPGSVLGFRESAPAHATAMSALLPFLLLVASAAAGQDLRVSELMGDNVGAVADAEGEYVDWVELYNAGASDLALGGYRLADGDTPFETAWALPDTVLAAGQYLVVWCVGSDAPSREGLRADFAIAAAGESVSLYAPDGTLADSSPALPLPTDLSLARVGEAAGDWGYLDVPTPGTANDGVARGSALPPPSFSRAPATDLVDAFSLSLHATDPAATIRYSLDGADVTAASPVYESELQIGESAVVKARVYAEGRLPSAMAVASYLFEDTLTLPIVSLAIDPGDFYGPTGIYDNPRVRPERALNVEYFAPDGQLAFGQGMGVKMHAYDRLKHKSLRLYARDRYGAEAVEYPLFEGLPVERFRRLVLRNGGNDGTEKGRIHVKDRFAHALYDELHPTHATAAAIATHVFLNGDYFGIYNLRERQDEHYLRTHYDVACDEADFLEYDFGEPGYQKTICGDWGAWAALKAYVINNDLSRPEAYAYVADRIDVGDFIDYQAFEIYLGNVDWLNNNIKFWRERRPGGKWRWLLWDTEYGMGTTSDNAAGQPDFDFFTMALDWGGWGRGDYTWMLRGLMANDAFRERFLLRYGDLLATTLRPGHVVPALDEAVAEIAPDLPRQLARWGQPKEVYASHLEHTRDYLTRRRDLARYNAALATGVDTATRTIVVDVSDARAGSVRVNSVLLADGLPWLRGAPAYPWRAEYLRDLPLTLTALPAPGYRFSHWEGASETAPTLRLEAGDDREVVAVFEEGAGGAATRLRLNEIVADNERSHADDGGRATDWIEVYNAGDTAVDLGGTYITDDSDEPQKWALPAGITVPAGGYAVLFADGEPALGPRHLPFRLGKGGEYVGLSARDAAEEVTLVDEVAFPPLATDEAYARLPDGATAWARTSITTPGAANARASSTGQRSRRTALRLSPNPASDQVWLDAGVADGTPVDVTVSDLLGRPVLSRGHVAGRGLDVSVLPKGAYAVTVETEDGARSNTAMLLISE